MRRAAVEGVAFLPPQDRLQILQPLVIDVAFTDESGAAIKENVRFGPGGVAMMEVACTKKPADITSYQSMVAFE